MARLAPATATVLAALALAACNNAQKTTSAASGICKPFTTPAAQPAQPQPALPNPNVLPGQPAGDPAAAVDDCLHRWGYTLAASTDPADVVADATVAACGPSLTSWNQSSLSAQGGQAVQAPSLVSGQQTNPIAEHYAFAQGRALFYVVQARAGHCAPPPAATPAKG
jgi:glucose/arabinose dehydrogenase